MQWQRKLRRFSEKMVRVTFPLYPMAHLLTGSFIGDEWGEVDTRFSYIAIMGLSLLGRLHFINLERAVDFILACKNFDEAFGAVPYAESHAGQTFCCVAALAIAGQLHRIDVDKLGWWLAERQLPCGGLNGRPEKKEDVCYSWWVLSALAILGKLDWIDGPKLAEYILSCQDGAMLLLTLLPFSSLSSQMSVAGLQIDLTTRPMCFICSLARVGSRCSARNLMAMWF